MIRVTFLLEDDSVVTNGAMHHAPAIGEFIWLLPADGRQSAYVVKSVAHWVSDQHDYHKVAVYVEAVK